MSGPRNTAVAIVGAGASGVMTTLRLIQHHRRSATGRLTLHLFDRQDRPGLGVAYATPLPEHILNMRARTMSLYPDDPLHFVRRLPALRADAGRPVAGGDPADLAESYPPRGTYGAYLRECLDREIEKARADGVVVDFVRCEVSGLESRGAGLVLRAGTDLPLPRYTHVVICVGDLPPTSYRDLTGHPRYAPTPWDPRFYAALPPRAGVGVIGTGLTAVDAVLALRAHGHQGPVYAFSRARGWPAVQPRTLVPHHTPAHLTPAALGELGTEIPLRHVARLLRADLLERVGAGPLSGLLRQDRSQARETLHADIRRALDDEAHWYEVLDATAPFAAEIWHRLRFPDRQRFLRTGFARWAVYRHPMPLANAHALVRLMDEGRLRTFTGTVAIRPAGDGGFDVVRRTPAGTAVDHPDHLINASGPATSAWTMESPLVRGLLDEGRLTAHPLGGIDVDFRTLRVRRRDGSHDPAVYFLGPLTMGVHFYTNSIETNLHNADAVARDILAGPTGPAGSPAPRCASEVRARLAARRAI